jgi:B12-binding domain/radical SAM domain protein
VAVLVLHQRRVAKLALDVLPGAVEGHPVAGALAVERARTPDAVAAAVRRAAEAGRTAVVAWSFFTASFEEVAAELAAVRSASGGARAVHVAGGPHASADPEGTLAAGFDLAALGEGEETLPALLARVARGEDPRAGPGLAWSEAGRVRSTGRAPPVDLDAFPPCAPGAARIGPIEITRGCAWACRFCQTPFLFRARFRHRSLTSVRRWLAFHRSIAARDVRFLTPSALSWGSAGTGVDLDAIEALLVAAREELAPEARIFFSGFPSELRPEHVSARALALIRRHCHNRGVIVGAQSGSDRLLADMGRGHDVAAVRRAVGLALAAGLEPSVDFIFGLPGETGADRDATRALVRDLAEAGARVHAHAFLPLPGTPWARAPAGRLDPDTALLLERLASRGRAHGRWKTQQARGMTADVPQPAARTAPKLPRRS